MSEEPNVSSSVTEEGILQQLVHSRPLTLANDARLQYLVEESTGKTQYLSSEDVWRESTEQAEQEQDIRKFVVDRKRQSQDPEEEMRETNEEYNDF